LIDLSNSIEVKAFALRDPTYGKFVSETNDMLSYHNTDAAIDKVASFNKNKFEASVGRQQDIFAEIMQEINAKLDNSVLGRSSGKAVNNGLEGAKKLVTAPVKVLGSALMWAAKVGAFVGISWRGYDGISGEMEDTKQAVKNNDLEEATFSKLDAAGKALGLDHILGEYVPPKQEGIIDANHDWDKQTEVKSSRVTQDVDASYDWDSTDVTPATSLPKKSGTIEK
jgi:hypothetical protein